MRGLRFPYIPLGIYLFISEGEALSPWFNASIVYAFLFA